MTEVHVRGAYATVRGPGIEDEVAVEEPLEIRVDGEPLAVPLRPPGADAELAVHAPPVADGPRVRRDLLAGLPDHLRQPTFARTGGLHATGLFSAAGELLIVREDVGRHNAMDKVIGRALLDGMLPLNHLILCVSGRLSFELVQKAVVAGAPILVGVGAPSSLAVSLAEDRNMTLCGFARGGRVNVYTGAGRVG